MKQIRLDNNITSSGRNSRFLATQQLLHRVVAILVLAFACSGAWATDYVFVYNGNYLGINANGQITNYTTFNPTYCVWTCYNGTTETSLATNASYSLKNGNKCLTTNTTNGNTPELQNEASAIWRISNNQLYYNQVRTQGDRYFYLYYRDGWKTSRSTGNSNTNYATTGYGATDYRATATASTTSNAKDNTTPPTVSCDGLSGTTGILMSHTTLGGTYTPAATTIVVGGTTYYKGSDGKYSTTAPSATLNPTYAWSINNGNASITNGGVLTLNNNNSQTITVRLTVTNTNPNLTKTVDYTLTATSTAALNETTYGDITITPSSQTLDLGGTATYIVSPSISQVIKTRPLYVTITDQQSHTHYKVGTTYQATEPTITETPGETLNFTQIAWTFSGGNGNYYTPSQNTTQTTNEQVLTRTTQKTGTTQTFTITATGRYGGWSGPEKTATATVTIPATLVDLTNLYPGEALNLGVGESGTLEGHYTWQPNDDTAGASYKKFTYTSGNTDIATVDENGKVTGVAPGTTTITIQSIKIDGTINANVSCEITVNVSVDAPEISIASNGTVTITHPVPGVEIRYTTDGSTPTATTGTVYDGTFTATNEQTIKAIAVSNNIASSIASKQYITSGVTSDGRVILYDYEDHSMTLYQSTDKLPENYPSHLSSPNPKDVKITYHGGSVANASAVGLSGLNDTEKAINTFVYYKTIERKAWQDTEGQILKGDYAYKVIPNPFSKRPRTNGSTGTNGYFGFAGWQITNGSAYIRRENGNMAAENDVLGLEEKINFVNLPEYGAEIEFTATWTAATVVTNTTNGLSASGTYETNFIVYTDNTGHNLTALNNPATVTSYYPDGTPTGNARISGVSAPNKDTKIEFIGIGNASASTSASGTFTASGNALLFVGRGCTGYVQYLYGSGGKMRARIESGYYDYCHPMNGANNSNNTAANANYAQIVFGNDYERATNDGLTGNDQYADNSELRKLRVKIFVGANSAGTHQDSNTDEFIDVNIKSGYYGYSADFSKIASTNNKDGWGLGFGGNTDNPGDTYKADDINGTNRSYNLGNVPEKTMSFYVGRTRGGGCGGINRVLVEGGELSSINGGGYKNNGNSNTASNNTSNNGIIGYHLRIKGGWIKGAVYGTASSSTTQANTKLVITGGEVNGWVAGACNGTDFNQDGVNHGNTYIYVGGTAELRSHRQKADGTPIYNNAWGYIGNVEGGAIYASGRGKEGTGNNDHCGSSIETNVVVADKSYIERNVCGGGYVGIAITSNVFVTGGVVGGSVYGGAWESASSNATWSGHNTNVLMCGGLVKGGVFGGNYGGKNTSAAIQENATVNIYGGQVGTDATHTANVFGGGEGNSTNINQNVTVTIGKSNEEGPIIFGDVYGGSAKGKVNGTAATTTYKTDVTLYSGTINGSLYGGGLGDNSNAADVYGPVAVKVYGGSVRKTDETGANGSGAVYGANNVKGAPQRSVTVDIYGTDPAPAEGEYALFSVYGGGNAADYSHDYAKNNGYPKVTVHNCDNSIEYVYGGGNAAAVAATDVTIYGGDKIGNVFGGGNGQVKPANVNGNTNVKIYGGTIGDVYGGSNTNGTIGGTISVNVNATAESGKSACPIDIDNVYGGGNKAASAAGNITIGCAEHIGAVYGGANQANITGNINLSIVSGHIDNVFGGNNVKGDITGTITVTVNDNNSACGMEVGNVYGGGNQAAYTNTGAFPAVNILKGNITGDVFGGGLGETAVVTSNPIVLINGGTVAGNVFGGGSEANTKGNTTVTMQSGSVATGLYGGGALADVSGNTTVSLTGGTVHDVYGGGLGRNAVEADAEHGIEAADPVAAIVGGNTNVTLNGSVVTGSIFGCNNVNGTPKGHVKVTVAKTTAQPGAAADAYHVAAVYGGGNQAAYIPTNDKDFTEVEVLTCDNSVQYVYGGGNAASTPKTQVTINGGTIFNVFGGGNGKTEAGAVTPNPGADVGYLDWKQDDAHKYGEGTTNVNIYGGIITSVFGGSNTKGNIRTASNVNLNNAGTCTFQVGDVYGAGNEAEMYGNGNLIIGCIPGLREIYGGAKNANIYGDVSLTIANGEFEKVFGGNNLGGNIAGSITVNIEETGCRPVIIGELYGGGNLAAYTAPKDTKYGDNAGKFPIVNVKSCTSIGTVFGGGLGMTTQKLNALTVDEMKAEAKKHGKTDEELNALSTDALKALVLPYYKEKGVIEGSPQVNIGLIEGKFANGGTYGTTETFPAISNRWGNKLGTIETVYGGGNAADVEGDTYVNIGTMATISLVSGEDHAAKDVQGVNISGNVYGGGNQANVTGKTFVTVGRKQE